MSFIIIKNPETAKKIEELSFEEKPTILSNTTYLNSSDKCLVCSGERNFNEENTTNLELSLQVFCTIPYMHNDNNIFSCYANNYKC